MESFDEALARALDHASRGNFGEAGAALAKRNEPSALALAAFFGKQKKIRHDIGNALSIAQASIEAMLDGVVAVTDPRLKRIHEILASVGTSMYEETAEPAKAPPSGEDPVAAEVLALKPLAETKNVSLVHECAEAPVHRTLQESDAAKETARSALLTALRYASPGSAIRTSCAAGGKLKVVLPLRAAALVVQNSNGAAAIVSDSDVEATVLVTL